MVGVINNGKYLFIDSSFLFFKLQHSWFFKCSSQAFLTVMDYLETCGNECMLRRNWTKREKQLDDFLKIGGGKDAMKHVFPKENAPKFKFKQCSHFIMEIFHLETEGVALLGFKGVVRHCGNKWVSKYRASKLQGCCWFTPFCSPDHKTFPQMIERSRAMIMSFLNTIFNTHVLQPWLWLTLFLPLLESVPITRQCLLTG